MMKMRFFRLCGVVAAASFVAGCYTPVAKHIKVDKQAWAAEEALQREAALVQKRNLAQRLRRISYRILAANADLCGKNVVGRFGFNVDTLFRHKKESDRPIFQRVWGTNYEPTVIIYWPGGPADQVGLRSGDVLVAIDGKKISDIAKKHRREEIRQEKEGLIGTLFSFGDSEKKQKKAAPPEEVTVKPSLEWRKWALELFKKRKNKNQVTLTVNRGGREISHIVTSRETCKYRIRIRSGDEVNAFANGKDIIFTRGMIEFAKTDEELATVVGHELAHNTMLHIDKKKGNVFLGSLADAVFAGAGVNTGGSFARAGARSFSQEFEAEADYIGLYYTHRAGFDVSKSPRFWRRMAIRHPGSIRKNHGATHPATPYRFLSLKKAVKEIMDKKKKGLPMVPDLKAENKGS